MRISLLAFLFFAGSQLHAQRLENIRAEALNGGEKVIITYDINGGSAGQKYKVQVYGSHNNFATSLTQITGDVNDVTPGRNKRIEWNAKAEITDYSGDITFELRADPILLPPVQQATADTTPAKTKKLKPWMIIVPAAVVVTGVVVFLVTRGGGDPPAVDLPLPPENPGN